MIQRLMLPVCVVALLLSQVASAEEQADEKQDVAAGHSSHGEAFNEGPRQKAYLMEGTGDIDFPVTTASKEAQQFINQGVGQLHGFWYFEAERSFRQAAAIDPDCAMAYWGMAMANFFNAERSKGFIKEAVERKEGVTPRERLYIESMSRYAEGKGKDKDRRQRLIRDLENIVHEHPDDIDAKAWIGWLVWSSKYRGLPISSHEAVDALLRDVLEVNPQHPCHHYRIHLWDKEKPQRALDSAARCGQAAPAIAHMWHMPGHIYARLNRHADAAWHQEASARVDHAQMVRDRVLPYQIHNYAHNQEWCVRSLSLVGRVEDAVNLAKNLVELPRHPTLNTLSKRGSAYYYGRARLLMVLRRYELWEEVVALAETPYLEPTDDEGEQVKRLRLLGAAHYHLGQLAEGKEQLAALEEKRAGVVSERDAAVAKAEEKAKEEKQAEAKVKKAKEDAAKPFQGRLEDIDAALAELRGLAALEAGDFERAFEEFGKAKGLPKEQLARHHLRAGQQEKAVELAKEARESNRHHVQPLANYVDLLWQSGQREEAVEQFRELLKFSEDFTLDARCFARLAAVAEHLELSADWRQERAKPDDLRERPKLDTLGPFRWHPMPAPQWTLTDEEGKPHSLKDYEGRPVIVIFYLGYGCLHCVEQLHKFAPHVDKFKEAGIDLIAVSSDSQEDLRNAVKGYEGDFAIPLVSNAKLDVFRQYRAYDDFEQVPLHGTFLIDGDGLIRWQDISYEPFNEAEFLLEESKRLLHQSVPAQAAAE